MTAAATRAAERLLQCQDCDLLHRVRPIGQGCDIARSVARVEPEPSRR